MENNPPQRRYVKVQMIGYLPCDIAHECHFRMKEGELNTLGETLEGEYYLGEYERLYKPEENTDGYFIVCAEADRQGRIVFWREERNGYTADINLAGRYSKQEAYETQERTHGDNIAVSVKEMYELGEVRTIVANGFGLSRKFKGRIE